MVLLLHPTPAAGQSLSLVPFEIKDQFDNVHRDTDYTGRILIVFGSDREGSAFHDDWESAVRDSVDVEWSSEIVTYLSVADLRGVPFFVKGSVKKKFSQNEDEWILLDWKGRFAKTYGFKKDATNIIVFASDGTLIGHSSGREVDPGTLSAVLATVRYAGSRSTSALPSES
jgi:hypothetical protein